MKDERKTKKQLISELEELRQRIAELEAADPERVQIENALRKSKERYRDLYENAPNANFSIGTDGIIRMCNSRAGEMLGYAVEDLVGRPVFELYPDTPYGKEKASQIFERFQSGEAILADRIQMQRADGTLVWINLTVNAVRDAEGQVMESRSMAVEITEQVQFEDELRESEERYRKISTLTSDFAASYWIEPDGTRKVEWATEAFLRITGYSPEEIAAGGGIVSIAHPEDKEILESRQIDLLSGKPVTSEYRILTKSGEVVWLRDYAMSDWRVPEARVVRIYGAAKDISGRKASEQALRKSEYRYSSLFESMLNGFVYCKLILDSEGNVSDVEFLEVNKVFEATTGIARDQIAGMKLSEVVPGLREANPKLFEKYAKAVLTGESIELEEYISPLDQWVHVMVFSPEEGYAIAIFEDITARKRSEVELKQNAERLATLREIDQAILATQSPTEIAQSAMLQLMDLVNACRISIELFEPDNTINVVSVATDDEKAKFKSDTLLPSDQFTIRGDPLWQGEIYRVDNIEALSDPSPVALKILKEGVKSYVNIPLMVQEELIGVLNLGANSVAAFPDDQIEIACEVADSIAIALQQARLFEQVQVGRDRLQLLSRRLVNVQEAERRYIAQELHDEIGQLLTGLKLTVQMSKELLNEKEGNELEEADELLEELMIKVRDLSLDLRPSMLDDLGLMPALLWHIDRFQGQTRIKVSFEHSDIADRRFIPEVETTAYRIIQEALTNVARHANVEEVLVLAKYSNDTLSLKISDEGVGFDIIETKEAEISLGLVGMQERANMLGGSFDIESEIGKGTKVAVEIPLAGTLERRRAERGQ